MDIYLTLRLTYIANILVAGTIAVVSISSPKNAALYIFSSAIPAEESIRLVGCLWLGIALISGLGLWKPISFSPILLLQFIYKFAYLLSVVLPALLYGKPYPKAMAIFFLVWVLVLPMVMPVNQWVRDLD